jgi:hypothetical protein
MSTRGFSVGYPCSLFRGHSTMVRSSIAPASWRREGTSARIEAKNFRYHPTADKASGRFLSYRRFRTP